MHVISIIVAIGCLVIIAALLEFAMIWGCRSKWNQIKREKWLD